MTIEKIEAGMNTEQRANYDARQLIHRILYGRIGLNGKTILKNAMWYLVDRKLYERRKSK